MSRGGGKVGRGMVTQQRAQREREREQHRGDRSKEIACSPLSSLSRLAAFVLRPRVLFSPRRLVGFFSTRDDHDVGPRMHILAQGSDGSHQLPSTRSAPFRLNLGREQSVISSSSSSSSSTQGQQPGSLCKTEQLDVRVGSNMRFLMIRWINFPIQTHQ